MRDGWELIRFLAGVCRPSARMPVCLGPWGDEVFQKGACKSICASLSLEDKAAYPSTVFHNMTLSRYIFFIQHLARPTVWAFSLGIILVAYSPCVLLCLLKCNGQQTSLVPRVVVPCFSDFTSNDRCNTCTIHLLPPTLAITCLLIDYIDGLVDKEG